MGIFGKIKDLVGIEEIEDDDDISEEEIKAAASQLERKEKSERKQAERLSYGSAKPEPKDSKALPTQGRATNPATAPFKLVVIEPKAFDDCPKLVDNLKSKKPVIINLEKLDSDTARKIFDFLSGATYALNGNVQKVANNIFVFAPESVDIMASVDHKGIDFRDGTPPPNQKGPWR